mmetsp:Transcript_53068/g.103841  ORF Transcript_53068/g.103841 Transcript_53068/m.103841 type:complete len:88 (+) Transcript_53068:799-1062(+)
MTTTEVATALLVRLPGSLVTKMKMKAAAASPKTMVVTNRGYFPNIFASPKRQRMNRLSRSGSLYSTPSLFYLAPSHEAEWASLQQSD